MYTSPINRKCMKEESEIEITTLEIIPFGRGTILNAD